MEYTLLLELVKSYIIQSGRKVNPITFAEKVKVYGNPKLTTIEDFYLHLKSLGEANDFVFKLQYVQQDELSLLLKGLTFPIIVFENVASLNPMLILPNDQDTKENIQTIQYYQGQTSITKKHVSFNEWKGKVCTVKQAIASSIAMPTVHNNKEEELIVITGFPLPSLVSEKERVLSPVKRVWHLMQSEKKDISHIYFYAIMMGLVNLSLPLGIQAIIGLISGGLFLNSVIVLMVFVIGATLISGWLQILQLSVVEILQQRLFAKAAFEFTYRIPRIKSESIGSNYAPELMNRFFDILTIQKSLPKILIDISTAGIQILFGLILLAFYHPLFVFLGLILVLVIIAIFYATGRSAMETDISTSKYKYKVAYWIEEVARSLTTFKLAGSSPLTLNKLDALVSTYLDYRKKHFKVLVVQFRAIIAFKVFITAGLLVAGGFLVVNRQISLGQFVAAEVIILLVISSVEKLISTLESIYDLITAADKVGHITDLELEDFDGILPVESNDDLTIELKNIGYQYEENGSIALQNINLTIKPKEHICITGFNGSGKSTLVKVISGLVNNYSGQVMVNGLPLKELNIGYYRRLIADNLNDQEIFEGTIEQNITLGNDYSLEAILDSIKRVSLDEYVSGLEKGMRTNLQAGGTILSKSVKQKILIARSIIQQPRLILVDEFFYNSEKGIKQGILNEIFKRSNGWGVLIISNDKEIMQQCDKIILMEEGKIVAQGAYQDLMNNTQFQHII